MSTDDIQSLRKRMDKIDRLLVRLINLRAKVAVDIGKEKISNQIPRFDAARESAVLSSVTEDPDGPLSSRQMRAIFREIISACRSIQGPMKISFLGPEGTFCHLAVLRRFGEFIHPIPKSTINEVFREVERGRAHLGVVPMENSIEGSVDLTLDLLARTSLYIVGEISIEVSHALISKEKAVESIEHVFSHPLAIAQCREWLAKNLPHCRLHESPSTAQAVSMAKENPSSAAIASSNAARMNALRVLAEDIQDSPSNLTRFAILGKEICRRTGKDKTSLLFMVPHRPGALFYALRPFAEASINLCRIESRPTRMKNWEYLFFLDLEGHVDDGHVRDAVSEFERQATWVKLLGSYPRDPHTLP